MTLPKLPGLQCPAKDTTVPLMDLFCRLSGFGSSDPPPEWAKFCAPAEQQVVRNLLQVGETRKNLKNYCSKCENLGKKGHFLVAAAVIQVKELARTFDIAIVRLSESLQKSTPPTLHAIYAVVSEHEAVLEACLLYLQWIVDTNRPDQLFVGKLLDECVRRMETSHGTANEAMKLVLEAVFEGFKRILIPWLSYGFVDSRTDDFFIKEPTDCKIYFKEIGLSIVSRNKAPGHFTADLIEKIAQYGYMRKFLGWRSKNVLVDNVLEIQVASQAEVLRRLSWKEYKSATLENIVNGFGELYSHAMYVDIFQRCHVARILKSFQQIYLLGLVDLFDEYVAEVDIYLQGPVTNQTVNVANVKLDRAFENTIYTRTYCPALYSGGSGFPAENIADKGFSCFYFTLRHVARPDTSAWDCLELEFAVRHPVDWFFHPRAMEKYKRIFRFLLRLKRLTSAFCDIWEHLRHARISKRLNAVDHMELFYWHYTFNHIITTIQGYIQVDVINEGWEEFQEKMGILNDYVKLMEAHDLFLLRISEQSMIDHEPLYKCINGMAKTCLDVCVDLKGQLLKPLHVEVNLDNTHNKIIDLYSMLKLFVKLVQSMSSYSNFMPAYLALKLDFNQNLQASTE